MERDQETPNAANRTAIRKARKRERYTRQHELNDLRLVLGSVAGRRFIWRLLEKCGAFRSVLSADALGSYYNAGQQDLGHFLLAEVQEAEEERLYTMMREAQRRKRDA